MLASERTRYIMSQLNKKGIINLKDVAHDLEISEATVRRDFEKLENEGRLKRVTGGAALSDGIGSDNLVELTVRSKRDINYDGKLRVAKRACEYIEENDCVFIDGGTSTAVMAQFLEKRNIHIVTHSELLIRSMTNPVAEIILIGGSYLPHYSMSVGTLTQQMIRQFHFDKAFISCTGADIADDTAFVNEIDTMTIKQLAMKNSDNNYLLLDSGKINRRSLCKFSALSDFKRVICDDCSDLKSAPGVFDLV